MCVVVCGCVCEHVCVDVCVWWEEFKGMLSMHVDVDDVCVRPLRRRRLCYRHHHSKPTPSKSMTTETWLTGSKNSPRGLGHWSKTAYLFGRCLVGQLQLQLSLVDHQPEWSSERFRICQMAQPRALLSNRAALCNTVKLPLVTITEIQLQITVVV